MTLTELEVYRSSFSRDFPYKIVATNGCFDVLHIGHLRFLRACHGMGAYLIVGMNSDDSVRSLKGPTRPVFNETDRLEMLASLRCVDAVAVFNDKTAVNFLRICRPHVWVKGGEWTMDTLNEEEKEAVLDCGGTIQILPRMSEWSTTSVLKALG